MEKTDIEKLKAYAKKYRKIAPESISYYNNMNQIDTGETVKQRYIDAVLADFLNFISQEETSFRGDIFTHHLFEE